MPMVTDRKREGKKDASQENQKENHAWGWKMDGWIRTKRKTLWFNHSAYCRITGGMMLLVDKDYPFLFPFFICS